MKPLKQLPMALGLVLLCGSSLYAGDKIISSDDKLQGDPTKDLKAGNSLLKSRIKIDESSPDLGMPAPNLTPVPLSRKDKQLLKDRQAEQRNWLLLEPGELQRKHEQESSLGVENNPISRLDRDDRNDGSKDYTLHGVGEKKSTRLQPGEIRATGQSQSKQEVAEATRAAQQEQRAREDAEDDSRRSKPTFDLTGSTEAQSAHTASELNFSKLLQPDQKEAVAGASALKGEFSLRDLMGTARTKEQQARAKDFDTMIGGSPFQPQGSLSLPVTAAPSLGSVAPGTTYKPDMSATRAADPTINGFSPSLLSPSPRNLNPNPGGFNPSGSPGFNSGSSYNPASPFQPWTPQPPSASDSSRNWLKPIEPMRRQF